MSCESLRLHIQVHPKLRIQRILNTEAGSFPGDQAELYKLLENKWDICLNEIRLWCSPLFPGYRSRLSEKKGTPYFGQYYSPPYHK